ncbi:TIGR02221 family CRISPR-associated protein [Parageobacillus thermoglucosidasius]|uniref:TIGR02221 family CRISPR-associated protein n=1 Tax=Parageobacillus thermoglucosidasius TaxID=1426 RepID=UPI0001D17D40|nr:TIGR02221 family CRISPR-associated protein [Parageobacillus thermoglucosidasius]AEH48000.1 CRISPR-associated protein, TM1812 family [Parageobacillus thermoglucosidasius C56-YS93]MBY6269610.1 TIGR02221 family CRISPR-associated protein [Parageobacillus thermoglucosidasius]OUM84019.1 MAG: CRISPR-associated protein [Parageobacillus thermoglucosidasius]
MARNVLLSFLGRNDYEYCFYTYRGQRSSYTRFVQTAIYELFRNEEPMDVIIFATKEAKESNWNDKIREGQQVKGIQTAFQQIAPEATVKLVEIESGQDESANWKLFDSIIAEIGEGDTIYFDITHSFRSIPFVALIVLNYARLVKKATIGALAYGWFEKLGRPNEVKQLSPEQRLVPIVDLTNMAQLLDWTNGVDQFLRTGDASLIKELTARENRKVFCDANASPLLKREVEKLNKLAKQLDRTGNSIRTCRSLQVEEEVEKFRYQLEQVRHSQAEAIKPIVPILDEMEKKYSNFGGNTIINGWEVARWCVDNGLIQSALTMLSENVVTAICRAFQLEVTNVEIRNDLHSAIRIIIRRTKKEEWEVHSVPFVEEMVEKLLPYRELLKPFGEVAELRNDMNHAGVRERPLTADRFAQRVKTLLDAIKPFFEEMAALSQ